jgi:hypothetical protein
MDLVSNLSEKTNTVICFLLINKIDAVPEISIKSVLENTNSEVVIGYVNENDIPVSLKNMRVKFLKIEVPENIEKASSTLNSSYIDFSQNQFFQIVQLKWVLISELLRSNYKYIIYSDVDVVWINNPIPGLEAFFDKNSNIDIQIQSFTHAPEKVRLCMGFIAIRNCKNITDFISICRKKHSEMLISNPKIGDDDVITELNSIEDYSKFIRELPQSTFPVGNMLNLYSKRNLFPGLNSPEPYIFHANFVVGINEKLKLLQVLSKSRLNKKVRIPSNLINSIELKLREIKFRIIRLTR